MHRSGKIRFIVLRSFWLLCRNKVVGGEVSITVCHGLAPFSQSIPQSAHKGPSFSIHYSLPPFSLVNAYSSFRTHLRHRFLQKFSPSTHSTPLTQAHSLTSLLQLLSQLIVEVV